MPTSQTPSWGNGVLRVAFTCVFLVVVGGVVLRSAWHWWQIGEVVVNSKFGGPGQLAKAVGPQAWLYYTYLFSFLAIGSGLVLGPLGAVAALVRMSSDRRAAALAKVASSPVPRRIQWLAWLFATFGLLALVAHAATGA